jgi:hypothetical protein
MPDWEEEQEQEQEREEKRAGTKRKASSTPRRD